MLIVNRKFTTRLGSFVGLLIAIVMFLFIGYRLEILISNFYPLCLFKIQLVDYESNTVTIAEVGADLKNNPEVYELT